MKKIVLNYSIVYRQKIATGRNRSVVDDVITKKAKNGK